MEKFTAILPCRGPDDVFEPRSAVQANELLAARTALWHPALISSAGAIPQWAAAGSPPDEPAGQLILVPPTAESLLPDDWLSHAEHLGARLIRGKGRREEMIVAGLGMLDAPPPTVDPDVAADFLALGYAHYVIETITTSIRYTNSLDESALERELVAAAAAACSGDRDEAGARIQAAFDVLHTARDSTYPNESYLLDLTLTAPTTLGAALLAQLSASGDRGAPFTLLLSAELLETMGEREPATLAALRKAVERGSASIAGGEFCETELPLLGPEAIRRQLEKGLAIYEKLVGTRPTVFARRRFGMTPVLPQILDSLGFTSAIHSTLDDGRFPTGNSSRAAWEGIDGTTIDALLRVPIDASRAEAFVRMPHTLSGIADMYNSQPTVVFAHWPGNAICWYEDMQRARRYSDIFGKFLTLPEYFERSSMAGLQLTPRADEYRSPYLRQAVAAGQTDPISRWTRYYSERSAAETVETVAALASLAGGKPSVCVDGIPVEESGSRAVTDFARAIGAGQAVQPDTTSQAGKPDLLIANPLSFSRRVKIDVSEFESLPQVAGNVLCAGEVAGRKSILVEVPPLGFACVVPASGPPPEKPPPRRRGLFRKSPSAPLPLAEMVESGGAVLRNEFFELAINPHTGTIGSIFDFRSRGPRLSQQVAMRLPAGDDDENYSIVAADEIRLISAGPVTGKVQARGRLVDRNGEVLAGFHQSTSVTWGSRTIELEIELDPHRPPEADPWTSYYAARFAWGEDVPTIYRGLNQAILATESKQLESPQFVEIRGTAGRTAIVTAGLPYHVRRGLRKLDSLLIVRGETARRFRLGIGIDLPQPLAAALDFAAPTPLIPIAARPKTDSAWLFHLDSRSAIATHWEAISTNGTVGGFRVRLIETEGRQTSLGLRSFRAVHSAQKLGGADRPPIDLTVDGDRVTVPLRPYEWAEVEGRY